MLGFLPKKQELALESRHLGLKLPGEIRTLKEQIRFAAENLENCVDIDRLQEIAARTGNNEPVQKTEKKDVLPTWKRKVRIGVAKDAAFCFYYEENLKALEKAGAELVYFSPLRDVKLPENLDGMLIGGGYPELYAEELENNEPMRTAIRQAVETGMPSLAECGGFMYLHEFIRKENGREYKMCGVLPESCFYTGKSVRFGYIEVEEKTEQFLQKGTTVKGHEFHYYDSENNGRSCIAKKPVTGRSWECIHGTETHFWGFPHLYYTSNPEFVLHFIKKAEAYQIKRNEKGKK